jgi:rubrerythrin
MMAATDIKVDMLKLGIHRETEARKFFLTLANMVDKPHIRRLLEELADEELEHKAKLELEIIKTGRTIPQEDESFESLSTSDDILTDNPFPLGIDYKEVLLMCIEKEDTSFRTYVKMMANIDDKPLQEVLMALAEEEIKHKLRFEAEYEALFKDA